MSKVSHSDIFKFVGLIAFIALLAGVCWALWPYLQVVFEPDGIDTLVDDIRAAGAVGVLILLGFQMLQVIVAFIPGEVTQVAAGILYGPWFGALLIIVGCVITSALIYELVHRLGAPFVRDIVPTKYLDKFREAERNGRLDIIVFVLFLIPGLPKDTFTYLVPLTDMARTRFLVLSNVGRIPGVLLSTTAASGLISGDFTMSVILFVVAAALAILGIVFKDRIITLFTHKKPDDDK